MNEQMPPVPGLLPGPRLGRGAHSTVWSATREEDGLPCAVKILHPDVDASTVLAEAAVLCRIEDEHVTRLLDVVLLPGETPRVALVTQRCDGGSLERAVLQRGHLTPGEVSTVVVPLAQTLERLHADGVVHGDIAPGNVLLTLAGVPVLSDLGSAGVAGSGDAVAAGTEGFLAPEVLDGELAGPASDLYALGALCWYALVGVAPEITLVRGRLVDALPGVDPGLARLVESCLEVDPAARPTGGELARDLYAIAPPAPVRLVPGEDPGAALTLRLRAQNAAEPRAPRPRTPAWRRGLGRVRRRASRFLVPGLVVVGTACVALGIVGWADDDPSAPAPAPALVAGEPDTAPAPTSAPAGKPTGAGAPSRAPGAAPAQTSGPTRKPGNGGTGSGGAVPAAGTPVLLDREAPTRRPTALLDELLRRRAAAWVSGERPALLAAESATSAAVREDDAALARASAAGVRYEALVFTAADVHPGTRGDGTASVRATLGRSTCRVRTAHGVQVVPPEAPRPTEVTLAWTSGGWRLESWRAIGSTT